jgi:hypothetical protein
MQTLKALVNVVLDAQGLLKKSSGVHLRLADACLESFHSVKMNVEQHTSLNLLLPGSAMVGSLLDLSCSPLGFSDCSSRWPPSERSEALFAVFGVESDGLGSEEMSARVANTVCHTDQDKSMLEWEGGAVAQAVSFLSTWAPYTISSMRCVRVHESTDDMATWKYGCQGISTQDSYQATIMITACI